MSDIDKEKIVKVIEDIKGTIYFHEETLKYWKENLKKLELILEGFDRKENTK